MTLQRSHISRVHEDSLVLDLRAGDARAYERAVKLYTPGMMAAAGFYLDPETAKDIVQEAWITVTKAIMSFEGRSGLSTWLHRIVVNKAKNHLRKPEWQFGIEAEELTDPDLARRFNFHGTWLAPPEVSDQNDLQSLVENDDLIDCLERRINQLPEQQRSAVILYELHQQSAEEVCQILDITISNLRVMVHRARQKIFLMLDHWHESGEG